MNHTVLKAIVKLKLLQLDLSANKMQVIKTVKELTGASLMEAKKLVETPNAKLKEQASKADAEDIQKKLAEVGAKVELK